MKLKIKVDADGKPVFNDDGIIVFIDEDTGAEQPIDVTASVMNNELLKDENIKRRKTNSELKEILKKYQTGEDDGTPIYLDAGAAMKAMETVKDLEAQKLLDTEGVEKLKASMDEAYQTKMKDLERGFKTQIEELTANMSAKDKTIFELMVVSEFAKSPTIRDKTLLPPDIAADYFGKHFRVEGEGKDATVVGYFGDEKILSKIKPGSPAEFEEALGVVIDQYPLKTQILRGGEGGSGSPGGGTGDDKGKYGGLSPEEYAQLPPGEKLRLAHEAEDRRRAASGR
jgi:hypothetical protein